MQLEISAGQEPHSRSSKTAKTAAPKSWDELFSQLSFTCLRDDGSRQFWPSDVQTPRAYNQLGDAGLDRGATWADQLVSALQHDGRRGILHRIIRDLDPNSVEAMGFLSRLEELLAAELSLNLKPPAGGGL